MSGADRGGLRAGESGRAGPRGSGVPSQKGQKWPPVAPLKGALRGVVHELWAAARLVIYCNLPRSRLLWRIVNANPISFASC